jgi:hypothetical protein
MSAKVDASKSKVVPILVVLAGLAVAGGGYAYNKYFRAKPVVEEAAPPPEAPVVEEEVAAPDLFPGRRNAHGIFYVPVKQAQETAALLAAVAAAQTNETSQAQP